MDVFPGWSMAELAYLGQTEERCQITTGEKKSKKPQADYIVLTAVDF